MKISFNTFWQRLQPRERMLLLCCAILLIPAALWFSLQAVQEYHRHGELTLQRIKDKMVIMQQQAPRVASLLEKQRQQHDPDWQQAAITFASKMNLPLIVAKSHQNRLIFKSTVTEFPVLIRWLTLLETDWSVKASVLELRTHPSGVELIRLELSRHG
ncbi:type II secretion system protein GspM [Pseudomonas cerasi]